MPFSNNYTPLHSIIFTHSKVFCQLFFKFSKRFHYKNYLYISYPYKSSLSKSMTFLEILNIENFHTKYFQGFIFFFAQLIHFLLLDAYSFDKTNPNLQIDSFLKFFKLLTQQNTIIKSILSLLSVNYYSLLLKQIVLLYIFFSLCRIKISWQSNIVCRVDQHDK